MELFAVCNALESKRIDPVTGQQKRRDCDTMRCFSSLCGEDGRHYEPKEGKAYHLVNDYPGPLTEGQLHDNFGEGHLEPKEEVSK